MAHGGQLKVDLLRGTLKIRLDLVITVTIYPKQEHLHLAWDADINLHDLAVILVRGRIK